MSYNKNKRNRGLLLIVAITIIIAVNFKIILKAFFPLEYEESILMYSEIYNVEPYLVAAVINTESKFNEEAISSKGAMGLMQIMPDTGLWIAEMLGIDDFKEQMIMEPETNICLGTWYLNKLSDDFNGDYGLVLAAYNGGPGNVTKWLGDEAYSDDGVNLRVIPFNETKKYVKRVKINYSMYKYLYDLGYE